MSSSFLVLFWGYFLLKPCNMGVFGWLKNKDREKRKGKRRGEFGGSRIFLMGWRGGIFGVFLVRFFGVLEEEEDNL